MCSFETLEEAKNTQMTFLYICVITLWAIYWDSTHTYIYIFLFFFYHKGSKKNELNLYHHYHCSLIVFLFAAFYVATIKRQIITSEVIVWMSSPMIWHYLGYCYIYFVTCVQVSSVNLSSWFCICYEMWSMKWRNFC